MKRLLILALILLAGCTATNCPVCIEEECDTPAPQAIQSTDTNLYVYFIDVGQGDAQLIHYGTYDVLIDCGKNTAGQTIIDFMKSKNIRSLDYLIMTHPDSDHIGGCDDILSNFNTTAVIYNGKMEDTITFNEVIQQIDTEQLLVPPEGVTYQLGNARLDVIQSLKEGEDNQDSIILKLTLNKVSFLFTGDCDKECETSLLEDDINVTVLKVAHHGSKFATSLPLLIKTTPEVAVISVGPNSYGHPAQETLDRLTQENVPILRTDTKGTITIKTNGDFITY